MLILRMLGFKGGRRPQYPTFTFTVTPETILVHFDMPNPDGMTEQTAETMGSDVAASIMAIAHRPKATVAGLVNAVGTAGSIRHNQDWAKYVTHLVHGALPNFNVGDASQQDDGPVVDPTKLMEGGSFNNDD